MSERMYHRGCPVCLAGLDITLDITSEDITITSPDISPLVKDKQRVVDAYRRARKLPLTWMGAHRARALVIAGDIISSFPPMPQIVDQAVALMDYMAWKKVKWDMSDAAAKIPQFLEYQRQLKEAVKRPRCGICEEQFDGTPGSSRCPRHEGL